MNVMRRPFGTAIGGLLQYFTNEERKKYATAGGESTPAPEDLDRKRQKVTLVMSVVVTVFGLGIGVGFAIWSTDDSLKKLGTGLIGTTIGYWLR